LILRKSEFGKVIFDSNGSVVYMFGRDKTAKSTCYGICAAAWPPVLTKGAPSAGSGLNANLLGTTKRKDGSLQVTYNHHPLYFYSADKHGKIMCQHAVMHGGIWLVLKANGSPNMAKGKMHM
jgi:predicted lipoprotein with Yx(FWY)xxD motif